MGKYGITVCPAYSGSGGCEVGTGYLATEPQFQEPDFTLPPIAMSRADGYQMGDVTVQGVRAYDPSTAQWVSPDAYAGTATDPGSQKPFMWNGNNPVAYGDPSGYYVLDNGTKKQRSAFAKAAKATDNIVRKKMAGLNKRSALYQRLAALDHDLQPGVGKWHIRFGSNNGLLTMANTPVSFKSYPNGAARATMARTTTIFGKNIPSLSQYVSTIVSEGGIYEMGSGNLGSNAQYSLGGAVQADGGTKPFDSSDPDNFVDSLINSDFNVPLDVPSDNG